MDRIMSTSLILLEQTFNANDVDIMVFEPSVLSPRRSLGGIDDMIRLFCSPIGQAHFDRNAYL